MTPPYHKRFGTRAHRLCIEYTEYLRAWGVHGPCAPSAQTHERYASLWGRTLRGNRSRILNQWFRLTSLVHGQTLGGGARARFYRKVSAGIALATARDVLMIRPKRFGLRGLGRHFWSLGEGMLRRRWWN